MQRTVPPIPQLWSSPFTASTNRGRGAERSGMEILLGSQQLAAAAARHSCFKLAARVAYSTSRDVWRTRERDSNSVDFFDRQVTQ